MSERVGDVGDKVAASSLTLVGTSLDNKRQQTFLIHHAMPLVVVATINIPIYDIDGQEFTARALLDSGSTATFITERAMQRLKLVRCACEVQVNTVGDNVSQPVNGCVALRMGGVLESSDGPFCVDALIMNRVVGILPPSEITLPDGIFNDGRTEDDFADKTWNIPGPIDILLGADIYHSIVTGDSLAVGTLRLVGTIFGLAVSGPIPTASTRHITTCLIQTQEVSMDLELFWKIEEVPDIRSAESDGNSSHQDRVVCRSEEEAFAERHF